MADAISSRRSAEALLRAGRIDEAVDALLAGGLREEAARALMLAGRDVDARRVLDGAWGARVSTVSPRQAPPAARPSLSGFARPAPEDLMRAARELESQGANARAAPLYLEAGAIEDATRCYYVAGDHAAALRTVVRLPKGSPSYRRAAGLAIALAGALDVLDFDVDQFIGRFLETPPETAEELEAFSRASMLFERHGFLENACAVLTAIIQRVGDHQGARERLARLSQAVRGSESDFAKVVQEDQLFRTRSAPVARSLAPPPADEDEFPSLPDPPPRSIRPSRSMGVAVQPEPVISGAPAAAPLGPSPRAFTAGPAGLGAPPPLRTPRAAGPSSERSSSLPPEHGSSYPPERASSNPPERVSSNPPLSQRDSAPPSLSEPPPHSASRETLAMRQPRIADIYDVPDGFVVAERYQIEGLLGRGGMAVVYRARDLELEESIAIKLFDRSTDDPKLLSRFKQELALNRQVNHPNVIRLYDIGTHDSVRFITMELLRGQDLADLLDVSRDLERDLGYLIQLCRGMQAAHDRGVVHRDLKPENVFVTQDGVVKLMDFGIAKQRTHERGITMQGFIAGTPAYMSPEQIQDFASATHLSDIYSIGVMAYRMFAGVLPFDHDNATAVLIKHVQEAPEAPSVHDPSIPEDLEFLVLQLLEKDPARRVQSCAELAEELERIRRGVVAGRRPSR